MENEQKKTFETNVVKPSITFLHEDIEYRFLSSEDELSLDTKIQNLNDYLNLNNGKGQEDQVKDKLYKESIEMWRDLASSLKEVNYSFFLNRKQFNFLVELLTEKLEYDVNTIFLAVELRNMLGKWNDISSKTKSDKEIKEYFSDATEITYIYHLISKYKIKGISNATVYFTEVLRKIGYLSKIINYYDTSAKNLKKDIELWVAAFEDGVEIDNSTKTDNVELTETE